MMKTLFFNGIQHFKCIGPACIDSCCVGWSVEFDQTTYEALCKNKSMNPLMKKYVKVNPHAFNPAIDYSHVALKDDHTCPFLRPDHLCKIQCDLGEGALSNICALYPRYYHKIDGVYEKNLSLACIEAANMLLSQDQGLSLVTSDGKPERPVIIHDLKSKSLAFVKTPLKDLTLIRERVYGFLNETPSSLGIKLDQLLYFHKQMNKVGHEDYVNKLKSFDFGPTFSLNQAQLKQDLLDLLKLVGDQVHPYIDEVVTTSLSQRKQLVFHDPGDLSHVFTNYLILQMQKEIYPFTYIESQLVTYLTLYIRVKLLVLFMSTQKEWQQDQVIRLVQSFVKAYEHHGDFHYRVHALAVRYAKRIKKA